jgi:hypothetical protein
VANVRKMQEVLDIIQHQEVHLMNTFLDMQERFASRSYQDCCNC